MMAPKEGTPPSDHADRPGPLVPVYVTIVLAAAAATLTIETLTRPVTAHGVLTLAVLSVLAVGYDWLARRVELVRRRTNSGPYVIMDSVWVFAAALNVHVLLIGVLLLLTQLHAEYQGRRSGSGKSPGRVAFNIAATLLPAAAVSELVTRTGVLDGPTLEAVRHFSGPAVPLVVVAGVAVYGVLNTVVVGVVIALSTGERRVSRLVGTATENLVELATLVLGALVGIALMIDVWLPVLAVPILVLLQRVALVDHLESAASEDGKTGLLNSVAWTHLAERDLERARSQGAHAAVMVVDLDHFKRVNDTYGHLTGDEVLRAVAECMRAMLRERDHVARFGGEEFVAFLPGADVHEAERVAERLRVRIAATAPGALTSRRAPVAEPTRSRTAGVEVPLRRAADPPTAVTVSIGIAAHPLHGETVEDLLARADAALYTAKRAGRNRTSTAA